jgi:hypothetical protein
MAVREKTHKAVRYSRRNKIKGSYEEWLGKSKRPGKGKKQKNGIPGRIISRTHIPKERVNQKGKTAKKE